MGAYKSYLFLVLGAYIALILLLHMQLQGFDRVKRSVDNEVLQGKSKHIDIEGNSKKDRGYVIKSNVNRENLQQKKKSLGINRAQITQEPFHMVHHDNNTLVREQKDGPVQSGIVVRLNNVDNGAKRNNKEVFSHARHKEIREEVKVATRTRESKVDRHPMNLRTWDRLAKLTDNMGAGNRHLDQYHHRPEENGSRQTVHTVKPAGSSNNKVVSLEAPVPDGCPGAPNSLKKPDSSLRTNNFQQLLQHHVYSAYYDNRGKGNGVIRVMTLLHKNNQHKLFCHFAVNGTNGMQDGVTNWTYVSSNVYYYEMCENHAKVFGGWIMSCDVPKEIKSPPCAVTISVNPIWPPPPPPTGTTLPPNSYVEIPLFTTGDENSQKLDYAVCIPPLFGSIPSMTLINFIEMTKLLGANHFIFYHYQSTHEVRHVLEFYQALGDLTIINWDIPVKERQVWYHGQLLAINDCLYRGMHMVKYMAFNDIDEYIVPRNGHADWPHMMKQLSHNPLSGSACGFSFQSTFFDPQLMENNQIYYDLESSLRTRVTSTVRTKVLVRPRRIFELGIHHISRPFERGSKVFYVEPKQALLHHYRKCTADFDPRMNCQIYIRDNSFSRHIPDLRYNVHQVLWTLKKETSGPKR